MKDLAPQPLSPWKSELKNLLDIHGLGSFCTCFFNRALRALYTFKDVHTMPGSNREVEPAIAAKVDLNFFPSVPNGVFNLVSSSAELKEFGQLHQVMQSNKQCSAHWERNLCQYAHRAGLLFSVFASKEALR